jgi:hypothetical protein
MERYSKLQQLLITPPLSQPSISHKIQSPFISEGTSTFGLTVTPLDFSSSKYFQSSSLEQMSQQESQFRIHRPITQPGHISLLFI